MKKKIKELNKEEIEKICNKNHCYNCPLSIGEENCYKWLDLNKEIEIKAENNEKN